MAFFVSLLIIPLWLGVALKIVQVTRDPDDPGLRAVTIGLTAVACSVTLAFPPVRAALDGLLTGLPKLLENAIILTASYSVLSWFAYRGSLRKRGTRRLIAFTGAETVLLVTWLLLPPAARQAPADVHFARLPLDAVFVWAAVGYMGVGLAIATPYAWRYAAATGRKQRRIGFRLLAFSTGLLATVCLVKALITLAVLAGVRPDAGLVRLGTLYYSLGVAIGTVLFLVGLSVPPLVEMIAAVPTWWFRQRTYRALRPLWILLYEAFPDLALSRLPANPWRDAFRFRRTHRNYYRRIIEIRDGLVQLRPYYAADVAEQAAETAERHGHSVDRQQLLVAAAVIRDAVRRKRSGDREPERPYIAEFRGGNDLDSDGRQLVELTRALNALPA